MRWWSRDHVNFADLLSFFWIEQESKRGGRKEDDLVESCSSEFLEPTKRESWTISSSLSPGRPSWGPGVYVHLLVSDGGRDSRRKKRIIKLEKSKRMKKTNQVSPLCRYRPHFLYPPFSITIAIASCSAGWLSRQIEKQNQCVFFTQLSPFVLASRQGERKTRIFLLLFLEKKK